ncbi:uncharacterized protein L969DRAFT_54591, partial [Mixia osmundae IAM 14324]|uniref:uncharacterized protein n=1 Tax=Mixia osmundae (strain CBS 9802 / IAM 14324 / JCM 22182 / KY 12970) TaxID=764103 RepID=UPI0004A54B98
QAKAAGAQNAGKAAKKKKWSKGKVKDKANNAVVLDKPTYDKILKEVPTFKMISQLIVVWSVCLDRPNEDQRVPSTTSHSTLGQGGCHQTHRSPPWSTDLQSARAFQQVYTC